MASRTKVRHGAIVQFKFNGQLLTLGENMEITERTPLQPVDPVGTPLSVEHIVVAYDVDVSFSMYRAAEKTLKALGLFPATGRPQDILEHEGVQAEVYDLEMDIVLERLKSFKMEENSRSYKKGQLTMYQCRGKCIIATDEFEN
ncbi:MAG: hypothetical protein U9Q07_06185 [Planctomycetota bacterium]|nr:hypothetical protein [Planctomycetota bacterium]